MPGALDDISGIQRARDAGYTDDEIYSHLAGRPEFAKAKEAGYSFDEVYQHIYSKAQEQAVGLQQFTTGPGSIAGAVGAVTASLPKKEQLAPATSAEMSRALESGRATLPGGETASMGQPMIGGKLVVPKVQEDQKMLPDIPNLPKDVAQTIDDLGQLYELPDGWHASAVPATAINFINFAKSPEGVAVLGASTANPVLGRLIALGFAADAGIHLPEQIHKVAEAKTEEEARAAQTELLGSAATFAGGVGAFAGRPAGEARSPGVAEKVINDTIRMAPEPAADAAIPDEILDGLVLSRDTARKAGNVKIADEINRQMMNVPPERVAQARIRNEESQIAGIRVDGAETESPPASTTPQPAAEAPSNTPTPKEVFEVAKPFLQRLDQARDEEEMVKELGGSKEQQEQAAQKRRAVENEMLARFGTDSEYQLHGTVADRIARGSHEWVPGEGLRVKATTESAVAGDQIPKDETPTKTEPVATESGPPENTVSGDQSPEPKAAASPKDSLTEAAKPEDAAEMKPNPHEPAIQGISIRKDGRSYVVPDFDFLDKLGAKDHPKDAELIPSGELPEGTTYVVVDKRFNGNSRPLYAVTPDGRIYSYEGGFSGISPWRLDYVTDKFESKGGDEVEKENAQKEDQEKGVLSPESAVVQPDAQTASTGKRSYEQSHEDALNLADHIAEQVARGQPDTVKEAARDAAHRNAVRSIESDRENPRFNPEFMRKDAMRAAGKAARDMGESLDQPLGEESDATQKDQLPSEELSPSEQAARTEAATAVHAAISDLDPREQQIVTAKHFDDKSFQDIAEDLGLSKQRIHEIYSKAIGKLKTVMEGKGYKGGPGAMGPIEALEKRAAQMTTGLKKATVLVERLARGEEPLPAAERQSEAEAVNRAMETQDRSPNAPRDLVARILDQGDTAISRDEAALLLVERNRVTEDMRQADEMLKKSDSSDLEKAEAKEKLQDLETQIDRLDRAQKEAGSQWGRVGRMYQRMIRDDYTLEGIQRKMRTAKGGPLTKDERAQTEAAAAKMDEATKAKDAAEKAKAEAQAKEDLKSVYEKTIADLKAELAKKPKVSKPVLDIAQKIVDRWKSDADDARASLRKKFGRTNVAADPTIVLDVARIMRAHVGEIGLDLAKVSARLIEDFGETVKPYLEEAWKKARELIGKEAAAPAVREAVKRGVGGKDKSTGDIKAKAKAEAAAGEGLSNKTVYDLARAHIKAGVHGEDAVMAAVHKDIKEAYPGATERDVRRAFSDYGKTKFPSQEAVAKELRELRALTRLQESIDRLKEGQDALKTGPQRDKATQEIREKQKQLNELLKTRQGPPSPEKLASQEEAKITALQNRIADIDKELRTGERPAEGAKLPDSDAVQQLKAERDAMQGKLNEIRDGQKPTLEETYNKRRMTQITKQIADLEDRLKTGKLEKEKPTPLKKTAEVAAAEAKLTETRREVDKAIEKKKYEQLSPQQKFFKEAMSTFRSITAIKILGHGSVGMVTHAGGLIFRPTRATIYWKNFGRQFGMWAKPEFHEQLIYRLKNDPEFETWKKAGASIDPEKTYTDYGMYAQWLGKLGEAGGRGFDALKLTRLDMNKADWARVPDEIKSDPKQADAARKLIADINNKATGATPKMSPVGKTFEEGFYGVAKNPILEAAFFAPRLYASRWGRVLFDPVKTARTLFDPRSTPAERFAANAKLRNAVEFTGTLAAALLINQAILSATGSKQNVNLTDPKKSDWLKFKAGGKTIVADGGLLDPVRLLGQVIWKDLLEDRTKQQQYREGSRYKMAVDTVGSYLRGKLNPPVGLAADIATGSDFQGRPLPFSKEKPLFKEQTPYSWGEWLLSQGPIPMAGTAKEVAADLKSKGFKDREIEVILKGIASFGLGMAGVHVGEDYSTQPRSSGKGADIKLKRR